jgi:hypothetical protein
MVRYFLEFSYFGRKRAHPSSIFNSSMSSQIKLIRLLLHRSVAPVVLGLAVFAAIANIYLLLYRRPPRANVLEEILVHHQQHAATNQGPHEVLLVGDSSCLMNIDTPKLQAELHPLSVLNLGTVSIMPLRSFAQLATDHSSKYRGYPKYIILIINPEMLRQEFAPESKFLTPALSSNPEKEPLSAFLQVTRLRTFFDQTVRSVIPAPLPGRYRTYYGFDQTFRRFLRENRGSAIDPAIARVPKTQSNQFKISEAFRRDALVFRSLIPPNAKVFLVLSPIPVGRDRRNDLAARESLLPEISVLLAPDQILNLPPFLHESLFSTTTHLRPEYRDNYTRHLAHEILRITKER